MGSDLGDFLGTRRARVTPADVGLTSTGHRRVPGLRREEVALLAGTSVDYYVRLEQGRERNPSAQVLEALAVALRLGADERQHLFDLAGVTPRERRPAGPDRVDPSLLELMDSWPDNPALVHNRAFDVLASNEIADALFGGWSFSRNLMEVVFGDPRARDFYVDWADVARNSTAGFRIGHGRSPDDPRIRGVLVDLLEGSPEFRELWARHDARGKALERKRFRHPEVGLLTLTMQTFDVRESPGQELVVYHAERGSSSADALRLLGTLAVTSRAGDGAP